MRRLRRPRLRWLWWLARLPMRRLVGLRRWLRRLRLGLVHFPGRMQRLLTRARHP